MRFFSDTVDAETWEEAKAALRPRIGDNLVQLREMRGMTPEDVAREIGSMTSKTLRNYEKGDSGISLENAWLLADYYGVSLGAIVGRIKYEPNPVAAGDTATGAA